MLARKLSRSMSSPWSPPRRRRDRHRRYARQTGEAGVSSRDRRPDRWRPTPAAPVRKCGWQRLKSRSHSGGQRAGDARSAQSSAIRLVRVAGHSRQGLSPLSSQARPGDLRQDPDGLTDHWQAMQITDAGCSTRGSFQDRRRVRWASLSTRSKVDLVSPWAGPPPRPKLREASTTTSATRWRPRSRRSRPTRPSSRRARNGSFAWSSRRPCSAAVSPGSWLPNS